MEYARARHILNPFESGNQLAYVVSVHRPEVSQTQGFEKVSAGFLHEPGFEAAHPSLDEIPEFPLAQKVPYSVLEPVVRTAGGDFEQVFVHCSDIVVDGLVVVVEYGEQIGAARSGIVQPFESQASCHCSVSNDGNRLPAESLHPCGFRESQGCRN